MVEFKVLDKYDGQRLDRIINSLFSIPYVFLQKLFRLKKVNVNGVKVKNNTIVAAGDVVTIYAKISHKIEDTPTNEEKDRRLGKLISMRIFDNRNCIAINKPCGLSVQPGSKVPICVEDLIKADDTEDFKLVHRLDRDTSGVLLIAKGLQSARNLTSAFRNGDAQKRYVAIISGIPAQKSGVIKAYLKKTVISNEEKVVTVNKDDPDGQYSETRYNVLMTSNDRSMIEMYPSTGRTHQLRVHCAEVLGTPILGDKKYGKEKSKHMYLHAGNIKIDKLNIDITAELPEYFRKEMSNMKNVRNQAHLVFLSGIIRGE